MMKLALAASCLALVSVTSAWADYRLDVISSKMNENHGVAVTNATVNGEYKGVSTIYYVPEGAAVVLYLGDASGVLFGANNTITIPSVTSDMWIEEVPSDIRAYRCSEDDPGIIASYEDLLELKQRVDAGRIFTDGYFKQTADIDFAGRGAWEPIGVATTMFSGHYDGAGHRLDNLLLKALAKSCLFYGLNKGEISNLTVNFAGHDASLTSGVGAGLVGIANDEFVFEHVITEGTLANLSNSSGGMATMAHRGSFVGCTNRVNLTGGADKMGGLVGGSRTVSGSKLAGVTYTDCANEGNITATKIGSKVGGSKGIGGITAEIYLQQVSTFIRCVNTGVLTPYSSSSNIGSILGYDAGGSSVATGIDCVASADLKPIGKFGSKTYTIAGFDFATVESGIAKFCLPPSTKGTYRVMLPNADAIVLSGVAAGDQLILENYSDFTGTVSCADTAQSVSGENGVWTVSGGSSASVDAGTLSPGSESGVYVFTPEANQTSVTVSGFTGDVLQVPSSISFIKGVDESKLQILSGEYEVTDALAFEGSAAEGYALSLDATATVGGVKVTPTIGENIDNAFTLTNGVSITVQSIPGLWYGLWRDEELGDFGTLSGKLLAEGETVTLTDASTLADQAFYKVGVSLLEPSAE